MTPDEEAKLLLVYDFDELVRSAKGAVVRDKLRKALSGSAESLKSLGVTIPKK